MSSFVLMTFFSIKNSGSESPTTHIIKASHVHIGIQAVIKDWIIGNTHAELLYIGIARITAIGTAKKLSSEIYFDNSHAGIKPCINHQIAIQTKT